MDHSIRPEQSSGIRPGGAFSTGLQILDRILDWLTGLMQLTEDEQNDAGIYLGHKTHR